MALKGSQQGFRYSEPGEVNTPPGFINSLLAYIAAITEYFAARLQLLSIEAKQSLGGLIRLLMFLSIAMGFLVFSYLFLIIAFVFFIQHITGWSWMYVTLAIGGTHFLGAIICLLVVKSKLRLIGFPLTVTEFKKDREWLTKKSTQ